MKRVVFYGDSITSQFEELEKHNNIINLGVSGDKTIDLVGRFLSVANLKPDAVFMMIGINDLLVKHRYWGDFIDIDFKVLYDSILTLFRDNIEHKNIYLISILPIEVVTGNSELNRVIIEYNDYIKEKANQYQYTYIDLYKHFVVDGAVVKHFLVDGVHLTKLGYQKYLEVLGAYLII